MTGRTGGATTGRVGRELAAEQQERLVELVDAVVIRRALSGCPSALEAMTHLEREVVIAIADTYGGDLEITAAGLGIARGSLDWAQRRQRARAAALTRDLWSASRPPPAADLVAAVAGNDPEAVASVLLGLDRQRLAALAVVLASQVADTDPNAGTTAVEHSAT